MKTSAEPPPAADELRTVEDAFRLHHQAVHRCCLRHLRNPYDAEDAVQEVFRRAFEHGSTMTATDLRWLLAVARNVCADELRRRQRGRRAMARLGPLHAQEQIAARQHAQDAESIAVNTMFTSQLLARLSPAERRVVSAAVFEDQSLAGVARASGTVESTARVLMSRARHKLFHHLADLPAAASAMALAVWLRCCARRAARSAQAPRAGLALPAALAATAALLLHAAPMPRADPVLHAEPLLSSPTRWTITGASAPAGAAANVHATHDAESASRTRYAPSSLALLGTPDVDQVRAYDVEASPNYASDHTILMDGTVDGCTPAPCAALFRSTDSGHTWTFVPTTGLTPGQLLLPPQSFASGRFYMLGSSGLEVTEDGHTFAPALSGAPGVPTFASTAPVGTGADLVLSNQLVWRFAARSAPQPAYTLPAGDVADGAALLLQSAGSVYALQPVVNALALGPGETEMLRCTSVACASSGSLPWDSPTRLLVSPAPDGAPADVIAYAPGEGYAVSADGGATFAVAQVNARIGDLAAGRDDAGNLLIVARGLTHSLDALGVTAVRALGAGDFIAAYTAVSGHGYGFACSADSGSSWRSC